MRAPAQGLAALALALAACAGPAPAGLSEEDYVTAYVEILRAAAEASDSAAANDSVEAVLERREVSMSDLDEFASQHIDDPTYMSDVWGEIERRLRAEPEAVDTTR